MSMAAAILDRVRGWRPDVRAWRPTVRLRTVGFAFAAAGVVHICATLVSPYLTRSDAYSRLSRSLPANRFVVVPAARPNAQILPFQMPDVRYAICRFEATDGPIVVKATLAEPGWTFSAYSSDGDSVYALAAAEDRPTEVSVMFIPPGERFQGLISEVRGGSGDTAQVLLLARRPARGARTRPRPRFRGRERPGAAIGDLPARAVLTWSVRRA